MISPLLLSELMFFSFFDLLNFFQQSSPGASRPFSVSIPVESEFVTMQEKGEGCQEILFLESPEFFMGEEQSIISKGKVRPLSYQI
jgi:hypothetical protein